MISGSVETIMTTQLFTWRPGEQSKAEIVEQANKKEYDMIPVEIGGHIREMFHVITGTQNPITHDLLLTCDTPIPDALRILNDSQHSALLVLSHQAIKGIITPSDFNKALARSYFYHLLAQLEMFLAELARQHYSDSDQIVALLKPVDKTTAQHRATIKGRSSGAERKAFNLDLVHNLMLDELRCLVFSDKAFRERLGLVDLEHLNSLFDGINNGFRRQIMHPTRPLLTNRFGLAKLCSYVNQVVELNELLENALIGVQGNGQSSKDSK